MISSLDAAKAIANERKDAIVVATMTPNRYWDAVTENKELDLPIFGAMGKASSVALGLALSQPDNGRRDIARHVGQPASPCGRRLPERAPSSGSGATRDPAKRNTSR